MELELKEVIFDETNPEQGFKFISLVGKPATELNLIALSEQQQASIKLAIQNEEQRIIVAPALVPDQKIYRNINGEEFNIVFRADTILKIAEHNVKTGVLSKSDIEHSRELIPGVTFFEQVVLSKDRYQAPKGFEGLPDTTLMLTGRVHNDDVWSKIKSGEIKGISIDGLFGAITVQQTKHDDYTPEEINHVLTKIFEAGI